MSRIVIAGVALAALTMGAQAQSPAPSATGTVPTSPSPVTSSAPPDVSGAAKPGTQDTKAAGSDTADQQTYEMKDGGMYQPPAERPASPAQDTEVYGRT